VGPLLIEAFRYHKWANLQLLDICSQLNDEQLKLTSTGTYGTIAATFLHLAAAEQRYVKRLGGSPPQLSEKSEFPGVDSLRDQMDRSGDELLALVGRVRPDDTTPAEGTSHVRHWVPIVQSLHHGNDHRTHICTILGAHGLEYGDMDVWAYGEATGGMVPLGAS